VKPRFPRVATGIILVLLMIGGLAVILRAPHAGRTNLVAYFDNSNGIYVGDSVVVLGVKVGEVDRIEPQVQGSRISFWVDDKYKVPADVKAVILSPKLITSRAIQLTPVYVSGPVLADRAVIPLSRTAVPVEFDDLRQQLEKLTDSLQPVQPGGTSPIGDIINTTADNIRGQGQHIRDTIIKLSQAISALGDHSSDAFGAAKNLATLVTALNDSADLMAALNTNLAAVTSLLADDPDEISSAADALNAAVDDVTTFVADNRESLGTMTDKLASVTTTLNQSIGDIKQTLHVLPNVVSNFNNVYEPAHGSISGVLAVNNLADPITFLCGAIQAASRLNNEQTAKLCVQYLAPIVKNRQYNFLPFGLNPVVNAQARPNEITYSEDWMRPDHRPVAPPAPDPAAPASPPLPAEAADPAEPPAPAATNPADGLQGMMVPPGGGGP
jgi:phospholipid/cholesterol/gamma-HCH transport system substrate-binding protein